MKLPESYYQTNNVVSLAKNLLGKFLLTRINGHLTAGIIIETEAYAGIYDQASHAFGNRKTKRTEVMYRSGGISYIYLCYGIHYLFNVVSGEENIPHAVLIRGVYPAIGIETMRKRLGKNAGIHNLCNGPGKLTKALGISLAQNKCSLTGNEIWLENRKLKIKKGQIISSARIGIDYAGLDAKLPYRFVLNLDKKPKIAE